MVLGQLCVHLAQELCRVLGAAADQLTRPPYDEPWQRVQRLFLEHRRLGWGLENSAHGRSVKLVARPEPPALNRRRVAVRRPAPGFEAYRFIQLSRLGQCRLGIHGRVKIGVVVVLPSWRRHGNLRVEVGVHIVRLLDPQLL